MNRSIAINSRVTSKSILGMGISFQHEEAHTPLPANREEEVPIFGAGSAVASTHSRLPSSLPEKRYPYPTRSRKIKSLSFSMT